MEQKQNDTAAQSAHTPHDHSFLYTEEAFASYWRTLGIPTLLAFGAYFTAHFMLSYVPEYADWLGRGFFFLILTLLARRATGGSLAKVLMINGMAGFVLGLGIAVTRLVLGFKFYLVFNLISETALTLALSLLVGWGLSYAIERLALRPMQVLSQKHHG